MQAPSQGQQKDDDSIEASHPQRSDIKVEETAEPQAQLRANAQTSVPPVYGIPVETLATELK